MDASYVYGRPLFTDGTFRSFRLSKSRNGGFLRRKTHDTQCEPRVLGAETGLAVDVDLFVPRHATECTMWSHYNR